MVEGDYVLRNGCIQAEIIFGSLKCTQKYRMVGIRICPQLSHCFSLEGGVRDMDHLIAKGRC